MFCALLNCGVKKMKQDKTQFNQKVSELSLPRFLT